MTGRPAAARRESLPRTERLRRRTEHLRCYRQGRRRHGDLVILYAVANEAPHPRLGITVSRKVGNSVVRHRVKRRIREIYRRWSERSELPSMDFLVHAKPPLATASFQELQTELTRLLATWLPRDAAAS
jgi:ribonuclease P protein component